MAARGGFGGESERVPMNKPDDHERAFLSCLPWHDGAMLRELAAEIGVDVNPMTLRQSAASLGIALSFAQEAGDVRVRFATPADAAQASERLLLFWRRWEASKERGAA